MSLKDKIQEEMKNAMRAKDQVALRTLRAIKSAIMLAETAEGREAGTPLSETEEIGLLQKQAKQRRDSIDAFRNNGRPELAVGEEEELTIIETFLPKQLSSDELEAEVKAIIAETGAASIKDMGRVVKTANEKLAGKATPQAVAETAKKILGA